MKFFNRQKVKLLAVFLIFATWMCACTATQEELRELPFLETNSDHTSQTSQEEESASLLTCSIGDPVYGGGSYLDGITIRSLQFQCRDEQVEQVILSLPASRNLLHQPYLVERVTMKYPEFSALLWDNERCKQYEDLVFPEYSEPGAYLDGETTITKLLTEPVKLSVSPNRPSHLLIRYFHELQDNGMQEVEPFTIKAEILKIDGSTVTQNFSFTTDTTQTDDEICKLAVTT
ncbi:hypothetical protein [Clostridium sp. D33t1_170424_F3]|uniref:hypothetical protein n=1 Tax=Clostridium sp. D33t1_170424_F3 TaxID=2787099 RepID=UPI0018AC6964|nr:hypothetical protein [Clostridium sp. D33t1_170424_F3]